MFCAIICMKYNKPEASEKNRAGCKDVILQAGAKGQQCFRLVHRETGSNVARSDQGCVAVNAPGAYAPSVATLENIYAAGSSDTLDRYC